MEYNPLRRLAEFHDKFHPDMEDRLYEPLSPALIDKRINLITEEFTEVDEALLDLANDFGDSEKWFHLSKELADLLYVVYGTAEELGIPLMDMFEEVHRSNMTKVWEDGKIHYRMDGKVMKPPTYSEANIKKVWDEYYP